MSWVVQMGCKFILGSRRAIVSRVRAQRSDPPQWCSCYLKCRNIVLLLYHRTANIISQLLCRIVRVRRRMLEMGTIATQILNFSVLYRHTSTHNRIKVVHDLSYIQVETILYWHLADSGTATVVTDAALLLLCAKYSTIQSS